MKELSRIAGLIVAMSIMGVALGEPWMSNPAGIRDIGMQFSNPIFYPVAGQTWEGVTSFSIPIFSEGFTMNPDPLNFATLSQPEASLQLVEPAVIASPVFIPSFPKTVSFAGSVEKNLQFAETRSSLRVINDSDWTNVKMPWLIHS